MSNRDQMARERALRRRMGMTPGERERLSQIQHQKDDWTGTCADCHATLQGTVHDLKSHVCRGA